MAEKASLGTDSNSGALESAENEGTRFYSAYIELIN